MPEGPEVKIITDNIAKKFRNTKLENIEILSGKYSKQCKIKNLEYLNKNLKNNSFVIKNILTKGKFIYLTFKNNDISIWITFGMTGTLSTKKDKHSRLKFITNNGIFYFNDTRNFGTIKIVLSSKELDKKLNSLGADPLIEKITENKISDLFNKTTNQNKEIGLLLLDQNIVSGIGNYLRAEILYDSKISPHRKIKDFTQKNKDDLIKSINSIVNKSYNCQINKGFHKYCFVIYGKNKSPNGNEIISENMKGRTMWWVPKEQF